MTDPLFDPVVHAPHRLQICAMLYPVDEVEFAVLRTSLDVSDSVLSKHVSTLGRSGYVHVRKRSSGGRLHTWVALTDAGRQAFDRHVRMLQDLVAGKAPGWLCPRNLEEAIGDDGG